MRKLWAVASILTIVAVSACNKATPTSGSDDPSTLQQSVIKDFTNNVALTGYANLNSAAVSLSQAISTLNTTPTDANLQAAQASWKNIRTTWEQCEGFLFGPVEDNFYDPNTDTWPTAFSQMDSLLASSNQLQVSDVALLTQTLRGYHPIEYLIFGKDGSKTAAQLTARQKQYLVSLAADMLYNNIQPLYQSWTAAPTNYAQQVLTAGNGSKGFVKQQDLFLTLVASMSDICNEVGASKMKAPFDAKDPSITESPYSGNTLVDFKNNIISLQNVYLGLNGGKGIKDLVASKNKNLDNQLQAQITAAINSFNNITETYEKAIIDQRPQVQTVMTQLATLKGLLDNDLTSFIKTNIQN